MRSSEETPPGVPIVGGSAVEPSFPVPPRAAARPCRILIVEDSSDVSEVLQEMLMLDGHSVEVANDGLSALAVAAKLKPHIALIDLGLPDIDGFEVARRLRAMFAARVMLVALTGYNAPEDRQQSAQAGFDAHMVKPVDPQVLEKLLTAAADVRCV